MRLIKYQKPQKGNLFKQLNKELCSAKHSLRTIHFAIYKYLHHRNVSILFAACCVHVMRSCYMATVFPKQHSYARIRLLRIDNVAAAHFMIDAYVCALAHLSTHIQLF